MVKKFYIVIIKQLAQKIQNILKSELIRASLWLILGVLSVRIKSSQFFIWCVKFLMHGPSRPGS